MMTREQSEFLQAAEAIAGERYRGDLERGFSHLAFQLSFPSFSFSDDQADDATSVDRRGDLGADAVYIADEEHEVLLFQSKASSALTDTLLHDLITAFRGVPAKFVSDQWVGHAHQEMKALANDFRTAILGGYDVRLAFATASPMSPTLRSTFADCDELRLAGREVLAYTLLLDGADLESRYRKLLLSEYGESTDVVFAFTEDQIHVPESVEKVIYLTLEAGEFVRECRRYGDELFRFNPRLYLGSNKVNTGIEQTLKNHQQRKYFHLLNNGVTAVCKDSQITDAGEGQRVIRIEDFQVVNGCQTTMTLLNNSADFADDTQCLVDLKIIQSQGLRGLVSEATNTQTAILSEDTFSNEKEQQRIHELMDRHDPPYFYAPKRGMWERLPNTAAGKRKYLAADPAFGKYRRFTSKELAAVFLSIFGEPGAAKDKPRIVFEKVDGKNSALYDRIFCARNVAAQWLLPVELFGQANAAVTREALRDPENNRSRVGQYGRYWMLYLCYAFLAKRASAPSDECLSASASEQFLNSIHSWGPQLLDMTLDALVDAFDDAVAREESSGLREFFREKGHRQLILERFNKALAQHARSAEREGVTLTKRLGFAR